MFIALQKELADANEKLQRLTRLAQKYGERVEIADGTTVEEIIMKIKTMDRKIHHISAITDTLENVQRALTKAKRDYEENAKLVQALESTIKMVLLY